MISNDRPMRGNFPHRKKWTNRNIKINLIKKLRFSKLNFTLIMSNEELMFCQYIRKINV